MCNRKHSNSINPSEAKKLSLDEMKAVSGEVYIQGQCGCYCRVKVNGKPKTWKRSPERVQIPYKYGLYEYGYITERDTVLVPA